MNHSIIASEGSLKTKTRPKMLGQDPFLLRLYYGGLAFSSRELGLEEAAPAAVSIRYSVEICR
jgi:hypothetical protein